MTNRYVHVEHLEWHLLFSKCNTIVLPSSRLSFRIQELGNKLEFTTKKPRKKSRSQKERRLLTEIRKEIRKKYERNKKRNKKEIRKDK